MADISQDLFYDLTQIIEQGKQQVSRRVNSVLTLTYWHIGKRKNEHILVEHRAVYGKDVVATLSRKLEQKYGRSYTVRNVRRMMQFANEFPDLEIVSPLASQLSWSNYNEL